MRKLMQRRRDEDGAVVAIVVLSLIAIFGMVVISVDVGGVVLRRREMVNANDSGALAAAIAFAQQENGATCGVLEGPAVAAADQMATTNVGGSTRVSFTTDCVNQTVSVVYKKDQQLFFAPVLGLGDTTTVNATATAKWGESTGGNPMPIELDPNLTRNCAFVDPDTGDVFKPPGPCPDGFWLDNDLTNSGWGLMNLLSWGVSSTANCDNAGGSNLLGDWITQTKPADVHLTQIPTYVCTTDGGKSPNWYQDLASMVGGIFLFPVNDPAQMIFGPPTNQQKYAIIAFAPMEVEHVYHGDQTEAVGTTATCQAGYTFSVGGAGGTSVDLDTYTGWLPLGGTSCPSTATAKWSVASAPTLYEPGTNKKITKGWSYDSSTHVITWDDSTALPIQVEVAFDWRSGGACPGHAPDPNANCLVLSWAGPQLIGTDPGPPGPGLGANSVTLTK